MFEVRVNDLRFKGAHGVFESERALGNQFRASVAALTEGDADTTDQLEGTVDYAALAGLLEEVSASRSFRTVEGLAGAYCTLALDRFPAIVSIEVTLDKLSPPGMEAVESCGVRLHRERE